MSGESLFYPPDASDSGVDCEAVVVVHVPDTISIARAAEILARSGAFGLIILDLGVQAQIPYTRASAVAPGGPAVRYGRAVLD